MDIKKFARKCASKLIPLSVKSQLVNFNTLSVKYGQFKTIRRWECVDSSNAKIPWYTYPIIEYLDNIDFSDKIVFEYGSGNSSAYWAKKAKLVFSVEHDKEWHKKISKNLAENQTIDLCENEKDYLDAIYKMPSKMDVIIIDGLYREKCAKLVKENLINGGIVILDNADWYKETSRFLREDLDLLEVDFHGFGPINAYTWTTSIFFSRASRLHPINNVQPHYSMAAVKNDTDTNADEKLN